MDYRHLATLRAAMDQIFPPDDAPGAVQLGADVFLLRLLELEPGFQARYDAGLEALSKVGFAEMDGDRQKAELQKLDPAFLNLLVQHTMEGVFADPHNGGNLNQGAWKMIGFEVTA